MDLDNKKTNTFLITILVIISALIIIFAYLIIQEVKNKKIKTEPISGIPNQIDDSSKNNGQTTNFAPEDSISATPKKPLGEIKIKEEVDEINTPEVTAPISGTKKDSNESRAEETKNFESNYIENPGVVDSISATKK